MTTDVSQGRVPERGPLAARVPGAAARRPDAPRRPGDASGLHPWRHDLAGGRAGRGAHPDREGPGEGGPARRGGDVIIEIFGDGEPVGALAVYNYIPTPPAPSASSPSRSSPCRAATTSSCSTATRVRTGPHPRADQARAGAGAQGRGMRGQRVEVRIAQLFLDLAGGWAARPGRHRDRNPPLATGDRRPRGTTVESAIRVLSRWGREKLVITGEARFVIPSATGCRRSRTEPPRCSGHGAQ